MAKEIIAEVQTHWRAYMDFPNLAACLEVLPVLLTLNRPDGVELMRGRDQNGTGYAILDPAKSVTLAFSKNRTDRQEVRGELWLR